MPKLAEVPFAFVVPNVPEPASVETAPVVSFAHQEVPGVGDVQRVAGVIDRDRARCIEAGCRQAIAIDVSGCERLTGEARHVAGEIDQANAVIAAVGDEHRQIGEAHRHSLRSAELRGRAESIGESECTAGDKLHVTIAEHAANGVVAGVGNVGVRSLGSRAGIRSHAARTIESRGAAARVGDSAGGVGETRKRRNGAAERHFAHGVIAGVGDEQRRSGVRRDARGRAETRAEQCAVIRSGIERDAGRRSDRAAARDRADRMIQCVAHVKRPRRVDRDAGRREEQTGNAIAMAGRAHRAGERCHYRAGKCDAADDAIADVGDVERVRDRVVHDAVRRAERCAGADGIDVAGRAGAGQRRHLSAGGDLADGVIAGVGHVEVAGVVERHTARIAEARREAASVDEALHSRIADDRVRDAVRRHFADGVIVRVDDVDRARARDRDAGRCVEARVRAASVVRARRFGETGQRPHLTGRGNHTDGVIAAVRDVDVAGGGVDGEGRIRFESRGVGGAVFESRAAEGAGEMGEGQREGAEGTADEQQEQRTARETTTIPHRFSEDCEFDCA